LKVGPEKEHTGSRMKKGEICSRRGRKKEEKRKNIHAERYQLVKEWMLGRNSRGIRRG